MTTPQDFYDFCVERKACADGLHAIAGLTAAEAWDATNRGDWMMWLRERGAWSFTTEQLQNYEAKRASLEADSDAKVASLIRSIVGNPFRMKG